RSELGHSIGRNGLERQRFVARRKPAIYAGGRDLYEPTQAGRRAAHGFEQALGRLHIAGPVTVEIDPAFRQSRHGGQVEDYVSTFKEVFTGILAQVTALESITSVAFAFDQVHLFKRRRVIRDEGIQADDFVSQLEKLLAKMRANETGGAGYQTFH